MKSYVWGALILIILLYAPAAVADCTIQSQRELLSDADCDTVPDQQDNCQFNPNSDQRDANANGIGDVCDSVFQEIRADNDNQLKPGDYTHITVRIQNTFTTPLDNVKVSIYSKALNAYTSKTLQSIPQGETGLGEFWIQIPRCQKAGTYAAEITATLPGMTPETEELHITVVPGDACTRTPTAFDDTLINIAQRTQADNGEAIVVPFTILNLGNTSITYELQLENTEGIGTWRMEPASTVAISAGRERSGSIVIQTEQNTQPGIRNLLLTIATDNEKTLVPFQIYVRAPASVETRTPWRMILNIAIIVALIILIVVTIGIASRTRKVRNKRVSIEKADKTKETNY